MEILKCLYKHAYALGLTLLVTRLCLKLRSELLTAVDVVILRLILCVNKTNAPRPGLRVCDVWRSVTLLTSTSCSHCPAFILEIRSPMSSYTDPPRPAVLFRMCNCVNSHLCLSTFGTRGNGASIILCSTVWLQNVWQFKSIGNLHRENTNTIRGALKPLLR